MPPDSRVHYSVNLDSCSQLDDQVLQGLDSQDSYSPAGYHIRCLVSHSSLELEDNYRESWASFCTDCHWSLRRSPPSRWTSWTGSWLQTRGFTGDQSILTQDFIHSVWWCWTWSVSGTKKIKFVKTHWHMGNVAVMLKVKCRISKIIIQKRSLGTYNEITFKWTPQQLTNKKSTLAQVMAWCCQTSSHYLSQCWLNLPLWFKFHGNVILFSSKF